MKKIYLRKTRTKMDKFKMIIYKCLPYLAGTCAVAFVATIIWCLIALILDL